MQILILNKTQGINFPVMDRYRAASKRAALFIMVIKTTAIGGGQE